ncbi:VanW family protein [soil metagenome]
MTTDSHAMTVATPIAGFNWRRFLISFAISLVLLVVIVVGAAFAYARANDGRVLPGVSVAGVSVAGMTRAQAEAELRAVLPEIRTGNLLLRVGTVEQTIPYSAVQRDYDLAAILDQAMAAGRAGNLLEQLAQQMRTILGGVAFEPAVNYDVQELTRRVTEAVSAANVEPVNAGIAYVNGEYVVTPAVDGQMVDQAQAVAQAMAAVGSGTPDDTTVIIESVVSAPEIPTAAAQSVVERATLIGTEPLLLTVASETSTIPATTLRPWIQVEEEAPGVWQLVVSEDAVNQYVAQLKLQVDQPAVEAQFSFEGGVPVAVAGQIGNEVDAIASTQMIIAALNGRADGFPSGLLTLPVLVTTPELTTEEAEALVGRVEMLGTWTTKYVPSVSNADGVNIRRPASLIDGHVVQPGEEFDFVDVAGPITRDNGYGDGAAIVRGNTRPEGILGGGLCSASTTLYNAALRAGFEMGARRNHAYYISRYPVGLDATIWISGSYVQTMEFTNDTGYPVVVRSVNKKRSVTFQVWGVSDGRTVRLSDPVVTNEREAGNFYVFTDTLSPRQTERAEYPADGFSSVVVRTVRDAAGNIIHQDTIRSGYRKVDGIVLVGRLPGDPPAGTRIPYGDLPPAPTPTPGPTTPPANPPTNGPTNPPTTDPTPGPTKTPKPTKTTPPPSTPPTDPPPSPEPTPT